MHGYDCAGAGYCNAALKKRKEKEVGREGEEIQRGPVSNTAESGSMACSSRTEGAVGRGETGWGYGEEEEEEEEVVAVVGRRAT